ncbi:sterol desaturase/sphingolipid hydroxylase (fatty acid hydroxylase superfamily) [Arcticibacter pallidicorallinus]|uniref:Sterol desaturase/sphingolipid hydroxylase (Fatty acid hydroxylase superfamily) n=1 Tax=Arcticibacter pallidicorallinus TaxID=1259464 RepID=A0A2T0U4I3_9SPHI|nr:sterol desaturase family protein [Arcticibacter pallidicorallinus]PRY52843.1 sterol desaturase/sphingolipid hydroxylase (fatty acid hydroxylase superfamily) [Arcticibacter pallidicorallinus]
MENFIEIFISIFAVSVVRYFLVAGIAFYLVYKLLERKLSRSKIQSRQASDKDFRREILHSMQSTAIMSGVAFLVLFTDLKQYTLIYNDLSSFGSWYLPVSVALGLIIHDTYFYWMHRFLHHPKIFRYAHLIHHKSVNPSPWASYSFHVLEAFTEGAILVVLAVVLPMHPLAIALFVFSGFVINVYGHLGYEIMPRGFRRTWLFEVINTSTHHNMHHSRFKGNYGLYFRFWDRVMGTEHPEYVREYDRLQKQRFG